MKLKMLVVVMLLKGSKWEHTIPMDQNITQSPTRLTHCSTKWEFLQVVSCWNVSYPWKDLLEAQWSCVWPQAFWYHVFQPTRIHKSLRTSHASLTVTSTGQRREHTPQLTCLQQDGSLTCAAFNLNIQIKTKRFHIKTINVRQHFFAIIVLYVDFVAAFSKTLLAVASTLAGSNM